jgi:hypothetical protein
MHLRGGTILDAKKFVQNHISFLEANRREYNIFMLLR